MRRALHTLASSEIMGAVMDGAVAAAKMKLTFGQKAASLAPQAVYDVAHGIASTEVDPATLDHVSKGFPSEYNLLPPPPPRVLAPDVAAGSLLSDPESRAALVVVLHRLLQGGAKVRRDVPVFISEALNLDVKVELQSSNQPLLDLARIVYQLGELDGDDSGDRIALLRRLKGRLLELDVKEFGIAKEELDVLQVSAQDSTSLGIAAISAHLASYLSVIADFVAGLSCEALRAKTSVFDDKVYRQDSTHSSVADAAKVMKSLLLKSMLVNARKGSLDAEFIASIPEVHGAFKESLKVVSGVLRVEINRVGVGVDKLSSWPTSFSSSSLPQINYLLVDSFLSLMASLSRLVLYSSKRILESLKLISGLNGSSAETIPTWVEHFLGELQSLKEKEADIFGSFRNKLEVFRKAFILVQEARDVMALEGAVALVLLSLREADSAGKGLKGPRDMTLGKGTARGREILIELLGMKRDGETDVLRTWFEQLRIFFAPKDDTLQKFIDVVKALIESNEERRLPQVPKGTRDFGPEQMMVREKAFGIISKIFKQHGAVALDTPVFELRETLMGKYGEDSKLIYDLQDQGGQLLSLRYDLTVPFARYLAVNNLNSMKRYHIAKVYRRDNPSHGRYREFYQCDFDIAGQSQAMVYDAEVIKVLTELLDALDIGDYEVKLNHRRLLDGMLAICGVPESKFRSICSAIDKLDKVPWEKVRNEMVSEKGLPPEVADKIGVHVARKGIPLKVLGELKQQQEYVEHAGSVKALEELTTLFDFLQRANCLGRVVFDLSLARGLDYYTGVIFEAVFRGSTQVGSIAAGGRYDNLVGMFSGKQVPAVGVSLGIERVLLIMEQLEKVIRSNETQVLVLFLGNKMMGKAFELASELWAASLNAEFDAISPSKLKNKLESAAKSGIPYMVIVGEDEESRGIVKLKKMAERVEVEVPRRDLIAELINGL